MRRFIPICLATVCAMALLTGPAHAQRGYRGGYNGGSYNRGYYGGYRGNYGVYGYGYRNYPSYGYYGGYGYPRNSYYGGYAYPRYSYYGGYSYPQYYYQSGYSAPQYGYAYNSTPYYVTPSTSETVAYNAVPSQSSTSNYGDLAPNGQAWLRVILPDPNARLHIEGQQMQQTGTERVFYTPSLNRSSIYPYTLRATWMENGQEISREKKIDVMVGQTYIVNFAERDAAAAGAPLAMPSKTISGEFVRIDGDQVVFLETGGRERSFRLAPNGRLTVGGSASNIQALKPGMRVTVTTQPSSTSVATVIEAVPN